MTNNKAMRESLIQQITALTPDARIRKSATVAQLEVQLEGAKRAKELILVSARYRQREQMLDEMTGVSEPDYWDAERRYTEDQGAHFMDAMGWCIANTLPRLTQCAKDMQYVKLLTDRYQALVKTFESGKTTEYSDDVLGTVTATVAQDDLDKALAELLRRIKALELPQLAQPHQGDLSKETERQTKKWERLQKLREEQDKVRS